jgi:hypothetical protein
MRAAFAVLGLLMQAAAPSQPPQILQIVREPIKPGKDDAYRAIEEETARISAAQGCPHPYLAAESLTGAKEIWWFNGYQSAAQQKRVADAYGKNTRLLSSLQRQSRRKSVLTMEPLELVATYRSDMSGGTPWTVGNGRFLVITVTTHPGKRDGTVFETPDRSFFVIKSAHTREAAERLAESGSNVLEIRPTFSFPAPEWIASDASFWKQTSRTQR